MNQAELINNNNTFADSIVYNIGKLGDGVNLTLADPLLVLAMYRAKTFAEALDKAERLVEDGGFGHTSSLYINEITEKEKLAAYESRMRTCRILVNTPSAQGGTENGGVDRSWR